MAQLIRPGAELNYETWGEEGEWVTLINGHNRPLNDFRLCGRYLVERGWRVLVLDNRGSGKTRVFTDFTAADMSADVVALWDAEGIARTRLLGISMGGFLAQLIAADKASRVASLILVSTAMSQHWIRRDEAAWTSDPVAVEAKLLPYFTADFAQRNALLVRSMAKQIAKAVVDQGFAESSAQQVQAMAGFDASGLAARLRMPTLVVHGEEDQIIPVDAALETAAAIKGAKLKLLPGAGHLLLAERPRELYALIAEFLSN